MLLFISDTHTHTHAHTKFAVSLCCMMQYCFHQIKALFFIPSFSRGVNIPVWIHYFDLSDVTFFHKAEVILECPV